MTNEERDEMIMSTHNLLTELSPVIKDMKQDIYGTNDKKGIKDRTLVLEINELNCPARNAYTNDSKRTNIAAIGMVISIIACLTALAGVAVAIMK